VQDPGIRARKSRTALSVWGSKNFILGILDATPKSGNFNAGKNKAAAANVHRNTLRCEDAGLARRFASRHHFVEVVQHVRHAHGSSELAHPLQNRNNVCLGVRSKQAFDVLQVADPQPAASARSDRQYRESHCARSLSVRTINGQT
jgi:hypothetical protein